MASSLACQTEKEKESGSMSKKKKQEQNDQDVSLMAHDQYMHAVRWTPHLPAEEEVVLFQQIERGKAEHVQSSPDQQILQEAQQARDRLVAGFQGFVIHIAKQYRRYARGLELLDLIQEGNLGLLEAIERFDTRRGYGLSTMAGWWIRAAIHAALLNHNAIVRLPKSLRRLMSRLSHVEEQLVFELGREPSVAEIAKEMEVSEEKVCELLLVRDREQIGSIEAILEEDEVQDCIFTSLFETAEAPETARQEMVRQRLYEAIETALRPRQQQVIRLRYGLDGEAHEYRTHRTLAQMFGTQEHCICGTEARARERLRKVLAPLYGLPSDELSA
jgi:RNA polymerase primary sigma factor